ncbi:hypothetical protein, partial [Pseudomonas aeruginosa]
MFGKGTDQFGKARRGRNGHDLPARHGHVIGIVVAETEQILEHLAFEREQVAIAGTGIGRIALVL